MPLHEQTTSTRMESVNRQHRTYSTDHTYSLTDIWNMTFLKQRVQNSKFCKTEILSKLHNSNLIHSRASDVGGWLVTHLIFPS